MTLNHERATLNRSIINQQVTERRAMGWGDSGL